TDYRVEGHRGLEGPISGDIFGLWEEPEYPEETHQDQRLRTKTEGALQLQWLGLEHWLQYQRALCKA
ncbi:Uncharacterized protein DAT39_000983, partial [Clarias magur]